VLKLVHIKYSHTALLLLLPLPTTQRFRLCYKFKTVTPAVISAGQGFVESASNLVPENVPRPVAKGGVAVATGLVAFWVLQKVRQQVLPALFKR
jgi:hypothetical protein